MENKKEVITISTNVSIPVSRVWQLWNNPADIMKWNSASPDWHTPSAISEFTPGGKFSFRMEAKDGSFGFDFSGLYDVITPEKYLEYTLDDGRKVKITFTAKDDVTHIQESFEAESENSLELQKAGWQAILDNFKRYAEAS